MTKHHEFDKTGTSQEDKDAWDKKYVEVEDEDLFNLILVAFRTLQMNLSKIPTSVFCDFTIFWNYCGKCAFTANDPLTIHFAGGQFFGCERSS